MDRKVVRIYSLFQQSNQSPSLCFLFRPISGYLYEQCMEYMDTLFTCTLLLCNFSNSIENIAILLLSCCYNTKWNGNNGGKVVQNIISFLCISFFPGVPCIVYLYFKLNKHAVLYNFVIWVGRMWKFRHKKRKLKEHFGKQHNTTCISISSWWDL